MFSATLFSILVVSALACDQRITDPSGTVTSPNHPEDYPPNSDCTTEIVAPEGKVVYLQFTRFEVEGSSSRCYFDKLEVYDGDSLMVTLCGKTKPQPILTTSNKMTLKFTSDGSLNYPGYSANFNALDADGPLPTSAPGGCGGNFRGDTGSVTSPNYPNKYDPNSDCAYSISLETGGSLVLDFDDFELESSRTCSFDYLEVRDGNAAGPVLGKFCGTSAQRVRASGDKLHMRFVTDSTGNYKGFKATWGKATCAMFGGSCEANCTNGELNFECEAGLVCCKPDVLPKECGKPAVSPKRSLIVGGEEATPNSWPWQASLRQGNFHYCGGSIITSQWVMTAAHCVDSRSSTTVVLGEHDQRSTSGKEKRIDTSLVIYHENFGQGAGAFPNDIALLKLSEIVTFNDAIHPACLPEDENQEFLPEDGCYITGWGNTEGPQDSNVLQELRIDPITNTECTERWGSNILPSHICVGRGGVGACNGDSGGPLVCKKGDEWVLAGATSWGIRGCTTPGYPSVYTRVSKFLPWINDKLMTR